MILKRRSVKDLDIGDFCSLKEIVKLNLPLRIDSASRVSHGMIGKKSILKEHGVLISDIDIFHIKSKSPFGNELLTLTPVVINGDGYGLAFDFLFDSHKKFEVSKQHLEICPFDVQKRINESFLFSDKGKSVIEKINS